MLIHLVRPPVRRGLVAPARGVGAVLGAGLASPSARHPVVHGRRGELHVLVANGVLQRGGGGSDGGLLEGLLAGGSKMLAMSPFYLTLN